MRRALLLALVGALLSLGVVGCGGDDGSGTDESVTTETTDTTATEGETTETGAADGSAVFASAGCGSCHTLAAAGSSGSVGPNLDDLQPDAAAVEAQVRSGGGSMPSFEDDLSDAEIAAVAAYVAESAGS